MSVRQGACPVCGTPFEYECGIGKGRPRKFCSPKCTTRGMNLAKKLRAAHAAAVPIPSPPAPAPPARESPSEKAKRAVLAGHASGRRRRIDPVTCERDYTAADTEFMLAVGLGYRKNPAATVCYPLGA